jgi:hypothetical protein
MPLPQTLSQLHSPGAMRIPLAPWRLALHRAASSMEVLELANDFVSQWGAEELAELPDGCRPWKEIGDAAEVHFLKHLLSFHDARQERGFPLLHAMCAFFVAASLRISELRADRAMGEAGR